MPRYCRTPVGEGGTYKRVYRSEAPFKKLRPKCLKVAMRVGKEIERVFGHAKTRHKMARARYRGIKRLAP